MFNKILTILLINFVIILSFTNGQQHHHGLSSQSQPQPQINFFQNSTNSDTNQNFLDDRNLRLSQDKREILQYLNTKNVIKTMLKLLFGTNEESMVTSRQVLNVFVKVCSKG